MRVMKRSNIAATLTGMLLAGSVLAGIGGVKKEPLAGVLGNAYGTVEISHRTKNTKPDRSHIRAEALYTLGSELYEGSLDIYTIFGVKRHAGDSFFSRKSSDIRADWYAYKNKFLTLMPYVLVKTPYKDRRGVARSTSGRAGFEFEPKYDFSVKTGVIGVLANYEGTANITSRPDEVPVYDDRGADLGKKAESGSPALRHMTSAKVFYAPNVIKGLYAEYKFAHRVISIPKLVEEHGEIFREAGPMGLDGYTHSGGSAHRLRVRYNLSNDLYAQNDFTYYAKKASSGKAQYANVLAVNATVF